MKLLSGKSIIYLHYKITPKYKKKYRFTPPLVIKDYEIDRALEIISETLTEL